MYELEMEVFIIAMLPTLQVPVKEYLTMSI